MAVSEAQIPEVVDERIASVRAFSRFYTAIVGLLDEGLLGTPYSLSEARIIFELGQRDTTELAELRRTLGADAGHLSRLVARLEQAGVLGRSRSAADRRRQLLQLRRAGREAFQTLDQRSAAQIRELLGDLTDSQQRELVRAMETVRMLLGDQRRPEMIVLREPRAGEWGWIIERHGALYAEEHGWDQTFEALVARVVADYMERGDRERERAWIAERAGEPVGCVLCTRKSESTAQLRLLLVEPGARGAGIGSRLVAECLSFASLARYRRITLWTNDVLTDARRIYERAGLRLDEEEPHHSFGVDLVGQNWSKELHAPRS